mgnify:CR=1 FL=1
MIHLKELNIEREREKKKKERKKKTQRASHRNENKYNNNNKKKNTFKLLVACEYKQTNKQTSICKLVCSGDLTRGLPFINHNAQRQNSFDTTNFFEFVINR